MNNFFKSTGFIDIFNEIKDIDRILNRPIGLSDKINAIKNEDGYIFEFNLPGYDKKNINVSIEDGYLLIDAKYKNKEDVKYIHQGFFKKDYSTSIKIAEPISEKSIKASYKNGILKVYIFLEKNKNTVNVNITWFYYLILIDFI